MGNLANLKYLYLAGNKIEKIESLGFLAKLDKLKVLDLEGCPIVKTSPNLA